VLALLDVLPRLQLLKIPANRERFPRMRQEALSVKSYPLMFPKASYNIISPPQSFRMLFHPGRPLSFITPSTLGLETFTAFSRSPKRPRNIQGLQASFKDFPVRDFVSRAFLVPYSHLVLVGALEERHRDHTLAGDPMLIEVTLQGQVFQQYCS
jgi:hypothetical protein